MKKQLIYPSNWKKTRGTYSPAVKVGIGDAELIFVSGQQVSKNKNDEAITNDIADQTEDVFRQLEDILNSAGATFDDVVKAQIFLTNMKDFEKVSPIRDKYFANSKPVSTLLEVNAMTRKGAKIEIEVTAIIKK